MDRNENQGASDCSGRRYYFERCWRSDLPKSLPHKKKFIIWGGIRTGAGWFLGGGQQVAQEEKPIKGGYDWKLIADGPARLQSVLG